MENDLKGNENYFELTGVRVMEGSSYRESTVNRNYLLVSKIIALN